MDVASARRATPWRGGGAAPGEGGGAIMRPSVGWREPWLAGLAGLLSRNFVRVGETCPELSQAMRGSDDWSPGCGAVPRYTRGTKDR